MFVRMSVTLLVLTALKQEDIFVEIRTAQLFRFKPKSKYYFNCNGLYFDKLISLFSTELNITFVGSAKARVRSQSRSYVVFCLLELAVIKTRVGSRLNSS